MDSDIGALTIIFTEFYYWITVVIMFLIHIGFCMYEVGASRTKNMMHTLMKNTMLIPLVTITFFFFGWWIYFAFPNGPFIYQGQGLIAAPNAVPWSELMGPHLGGAPATQALSADDTALWSTEAGPVIIGVIPPRKKLMIFKSCRRDLDAFCAGVSYGEGRQLHCLFSNQASLSPDCQGALAKLTR